MIALPATATIRSTLAISREALRSDAAPHNEAAHLSETIVRLFENATSLVLAIAAQALAVGVILAI